MECQEAIDLMDVALEGRVAPASRGGFDGHLEECGPCRNYYAQLGTSVRALGKLSPPGGTSARRDELLEEFRRKLHDKEPDA